MAKFHISSNGEPAACTAKIKCRLGGDSGKENHFDTPEEAREAYEKSQSSENLPKASNKLKAADYKFSKEEEMLIKQSNAQAAYEKSFPKFSIVAADRKKIEKVLESGKVSDKVADELLDKRETLFVRSVYSTKESNEKHAEGVDKVYGYIKKLREGSNTPSTLPTTDSFDPSKETVFSDKDARNNPYVASRTLKKSLDESDKFKKISSEVSERFNNTSDEYEKEVLAEELKTLSIASDRHLAKSEAVAKEMIWLSENNESFKSRLDTNQLKSIQSLVVKSKRNNVPIKGVKAVK